MPRLPVGTKRVDLGQANPAYKGLWIDIRAGLNNKMLEEEQDILHTFGEIQAERAKYVAENPTDPAPVLPPRWFETICRRLSMLAIATNVDEDLDGNPLPKPTDPEFWAVMPGDIRDAVMDRWLDRTPVATSAGDNVTPFVKPLASS